MVEVVNRFKIVLFRVIYVYSKIKGKVNNRGDALLLLTNILYNY